VIFLDKHYGLFSGESIAVNTYKLLKLSKL